MKKYTPLILSILLGILLLAYLFLNYRLNRVERFLETDVSSLEQKWYSNLGDVGTNIVSFDLPDQLHFAGETIPMDRQDLHERMDKEMLSNIYFHSNTIFLMKRANRWLPQFESILRERGIPDDFKYMPLIESGLLNVVSPRGAAGFWQIVRSAGKELGLEINSEVDERYDPIKSTQAACKYLLKAYKKFGNWSLAAAAYNRGITGLNKTLKKQKVNSYYDLLLNNETSRYVFRILAIKQIFEHPDLYGFKIDSSHLYQQESVVYRDVDKTIPNLVDYAIEQGVTYSLLKRYNPWLRTNRLSIRRGKQYRIAMPDSVSSGTNSFSVDKSLAK